MLGAILGGVVAIMSLSRVIEDSQEFGGNMRNATNEQFASYPVTQMAFPDGRQITNVYDALYRRTLVEETSGGADIASWEFFGPSRVAEVALGNGLICSHMNNARTNSAVQAGVSNPAWGDQSSDRLGYDGAGRMITKRYLAGGINGTTGAYDDPTAVVGQTTAFDKASNKLYERSLQAESRSSLYEPIDADGNAQGGYDSIDRLRQYQRGVLSDGSGGGNPAPAGGSVVTPISLPGTDESRDYDLDGLGNWRKTTFDPVGGSQTTQKRDHNGLNQITRLIQNSTKTPLSYDLNGNLLDDGVRKYEWDALNRLKQVSKTPATPVLIGEYTYDAMGRRIQKVVSNGGLSGSIPNGTIDFLYHSGVAQCCEERNGSNSATKQYVWGSYIDELLQQKTFTTINGNAAGEYYPLCDTLYRTVALTDSTGSIAEAYDTDAYGNTLIFTAAGTGGDWWADDATQGDNPTCEFIFTGRRYDSESEIYFYRARYYAPVLGRFASRDLITYPGGENRYRYVRSAPLTLLDPNGEKPEKTRNSQGKWNGLSITVGAVKYPEGIKYPATEFLGQQIPANYDGIDKYILDNKEWFDVVSNSAAEFFAGIKAIVEQCRTNGGSAEQCCIRRIRISGHSSGGLGGEEGYEVLKAKGLIDKLVALMCQDKHKNIKNLQCFGFDAYDPDGEASLLAGIGFGQGTFVLGEMLRRSGGGTYTAYPGTTRGIIERYVDDPEFAKEYGPREKSKTVTITSGMSRSELIETITAYAGKHSAEYRRENPE